MVTPFFPQWPCSVLTYVKYHTYTTALFQYAIKYSYSMMCLQCINNYICTLCTPIMSVHLFKYSSTHNTSKRSTLCCQQIFSTCRPIPKQLFYVFKSDLFSVSSWICFPTSFRNPVGLHIDCHGTPHHWNEWN